MKQNNINILQQVGPIQIRPLVRSEDRTQDLMLLHIQ